METNLINDKMVDQNSDLDDLLDDAFQDFKITKTNKEDLSEGSNLKNSNLSVQSSVSSAISNIHSAVKSAVDSSSRKNDGVEYDALSAEFVKLAKAAADTTSDASTNQFINNFKNGRGKIDSAVENFEIPSNEELDMFMKYLSVEGEENPGKELDSLFPLMQSMIENILSKDILYPPMKQMVTKFPDWLGDNRHKLEDSELKRFNKQFDIMKQIVDEFEKDDVGRTDSKRASVAVSLLMQELQELGFPPSELLNQEADLAEGWKSQDAFNLNSLFQQFNFPNPNCSQKDFTDLPNFTGINPNSGGNEQCTLM